MLNQNHMEQVKLCPLKTYQTYPQSNNITASISPRLLELQQSAWFALYHMSALQVTTFQGYPLTAHTLSDVSGRHAVLDPY